MTRPVDPYRTYAERARDAEYARRRCSYCGCQQTETNDVRWVPYGWRCDECRIQHESQEEIQS